MDPFRPRHPPSIFIVSTVVSSEKIQESQDNQEQVPYVYSTVTRKREEVPSTNLVRVSGPSGEHSTVLDVSLVFNPSRGQRLRPKPPIRPRRQYWGVGVTQERPVREMPVKTKEG